MITEITFNWHYTTDIGESFTRRIVGKEYGNLGVCESIEEHRAQEEGDKWYYDIVFRSGQTERIFNPNTVKREHQD